MDLFRRLATEAPDQQLFPEVKPTLIISWWCVLFSITVILFRIVGRYVRTERLFKDDRIMILAIVPLLTRAALVHIVLLFGTNNTVTSGLTADEIRQREIGSRVALVARIMFTASIWTMKYSVSMFLGAMTGQISPQSHHRKLSSLHILLAITFLAALIGDLGECHPFTHYYQVIPDPGPQCRQGYAFLFTMGISDIITNIALIIFPISIIVTSFLPKKQQFFILLRMSLPLLGIGYTIFHLFNATKYHGAQPERSLLASFSILLTAFTSNAVVLGSLLSDKGYKKSKFKHPSLSKIETGSRTKPGNRWGSDEDLIAGEEEAIGMRVLNGATVETLRRPPKALYQEIRVKQTWDIQVDEIGKDDKI